MSLFGPDLSKPFLDLLDVVQHMNNVQMQSIETMSTSVLEILKILKTIDERITALEKGSSNATTISH